MAEPETLYHANRILISEQFAARSLHSQKQHFSENLSKTFAL